MHSQDMRLLISLQTKEAHDMLKGSRQTFWSSGTGIKFLDYIKSNGSAYVDTGFVVSDYLTEIHVTAS